MKIFISWSGTRSHYIAEQLHWWLPHVLQSVRPFISSRNISKGARGSIILAEELENANVGIVCLTPENQFEPWILYESGALSKLRADYLCTFLYGLTPSDVKPPLGDFQHTQNTPEDISALVRTINSVLPTEQKLESSILDETLETWLPKLQTRLESIPDRPEEEPMPEKRDDSSKIDEMLNLLRGLQGNLIRATEPLSKSVPTLTFGIIHNTLRIMFAELESTDDVIREGMPLPPAVLAVFHRCSDRERAAIIGNQIVMHGLTKVEYLWGTEAHKFFAFLSNTKIG